MAFANDESLCCDELFYSVTSSFVQLLFLLHSYVVEIR